MSATMLLLNVWNIVYASNTWWAAYPTANARTATSTARYRQSPWRRLTPTSPRYAKPPTSPVRTRIETHFVGATYRNTYAGLDLDVLALEDRNVPAGGVGLVAVVQYKHGELDDESAQAIADNESYELVQSGEGIEPEDDACAERDHAFETDDLREAPNLARCEHCGLSRETIRSWLELDVPAICDSCDSQAYAVEYRGEWAFCSNYL